MSGLHRRTHLAVLLLAIAILLASLQWGTKIAGGADPYGYLTEAGLFGQGHAIVHQAVIRQSPWPGADGTWTPIGYRELPRLRDAMAPVYAPGLPLLMALFQAVFGYCGAFWVVPICGAATIWLTYALGRRVFGRPDVAVWAALLVATSPTFLYQVMNPMSDVPVTAAWTFALVLMLAARPFAAGIAAAVAIAIRPNLVPVIAALLTWTAVQDWQHRLSDGRFGTQTIRIALASIPAVIGVAWFNARLYGSPLESGYGQLEDLYAWRYLWKNVTQFSIWIAQTDTPVMALSTLFFLTPRLLPAARVAASRLLLGGFAAIVILSYLFYLPFDAWWYLRFLLPIWPVVMLLTAAAMDGVARRWLPRRARVLIGALITLLALHGVIVTARLGGFALWRGESRYVDVARFVAASTDPTAVFLSWQHSGSIRLYGDRLTLHFGRLDRRWLDRAVAHLQSIGRHPYFVLDGFEIETFRQRFSAENRLGSLDWTPIAVYENPYVVVYDPARRDADIETAMIPPRRVQSGRDCAVPPVWPPRVQVD